MNSITPLLFFITVSIFAQSKDQETQKINLLMNTWHKDAAAARLDNYLNSMTDDAVYIGTDATEYWNKKQFEAFAKPYFDSKKTWSFRPLERHVYVSNDHKTAWFDELLSTQMKICRGSGVLVYSKNGWKIKHYVLSMTVPNDKSNEVIKIKTDIEDKIISGFNK